MKNDYARNCKRWNIKYKVKILAWSKLKAESIFWKIKLKGFLTSLKGKVKGCLKSRRKRISFLKKSSRDSSRGIIICSSERISLKKSKCISKLSRTPSWKVGMTCTPNKMISGTNNKIWSSLLITFSKKNQILTNTKPSWAENRNKWMRNRPNWTKDKLNLILN